MSVSFFGLQLAIPTTPWDPPEGRLRDVLAHALVDQTREHNRTTFRLLADAALALLPRAELAAWDLVRGPNARTEWDDWVSGIEEARGENATPVSPSGEGYVLFTLVLLVDEGSDSDRALGEACDLPEDEWATRATFERLLASIRTLHFSSVRADAAYLVPNHPGRALAHEALHGEGFEYLGPLT